MRLLHRSGSYLGIFLTRRSLGRTGNRQRSHSKLACSFRARMCVTSMQTTRRQVVRVRPCVVFWSSSDSCQIGSSGWCVHIVKCRTNMPTLQTLTPLTSEPYRGCIDSVTPSVDQPCYGNGAQDRVGFRPRRPAKRCHVRPHPGRRCSTLSIIGGDMIWESSACRCVCCGL